MKNTNMTKFDSLMQVPYHSKFDKYVRLYLVAP